MKVVIIELDRDDEGLIVRLGNSYEVPVGEAIERIESGEVKALEFPIDDKTRKGTIPEEWREVE